MEITGFNESKTGQKGAAVENTEEGRADVRTEVKHFTTEMTMDSAYGWTWNQIVKEYLRSGYNAAASSHDIVVMGKTYKTLKRPEVTVFYDAAGDTLFDVTNERLEKEYEWLMNSGAGADMEHGDSGEESGNVAEKENNSMDEEERDIEAGETPETEQTEDEEEDVPPDKTDDDMIPMGKTSLKEIITGLPAPNVEEIEAAREENAKQRAKEKLEKELKANNNKSFAEPIIGYLLKRCAEDEGLAQDVMQEHKAWNKCIDYIFSQARKQSSERCAAVRDDVVYEWAEDYYHMDDKAEEEKKANKGAENKAKREKAVAERKNTGVGETNKTRDPKKVEVQKEPTKPTRNGKDIEGQLDMFSMMGM